MNEAVTPGAVMLLPVDVEKDLVVLVLSADVDQVTVLVLDGRLLGVGPGQVRVIHGLVSLLQPL
jgi:hypothetical protein